MARLARAGLCAFVLVAVAACGESKSPGSVFTVIADGSSTVYPVSEAAGEAFQNQQKGRVRVTVAESGTGGGFRKFCRGETHIQGASRPITVEEMKACAAAGISFIEAPIAFDALTVVVHPQNPVSEITIDELKKIWEPEAQGKITNWRQVNPAFPDQPLLLYGAGTASGTFDYFTEAVVGRVKASRTDYTPTEDDNVTVQGVSGDRSAMGYFGMAYLTGNTERVKALSISYQGRPAVAPSVESVKSGAYQPLSRPLFLYFNAAALDIVPAKLFIDFYIAQAPQFAETAGYVPLPDEFYTALAERVENRILGTAFGGVADIGGPIDDIMARQPTTDIPAAE